jgi:nucleoid-associated protein YgaU
LYDEIQNGAPQVNGQGANANANANTGANNVQPRPSNLITAQPRDTLSQLAERHLGSSRHWKALLETNRDQLQSAQDLRPGMTLRLPKVEQPAAQSAAPAAPAPTRAPIAATARNVTIYKVKPGDNLLSIAEATLGDRGKWRDIHRANLQTIPNADDVEAGLTLVIPRN